MNFTYRIRFIIHLSYPERLAVLNLEPLELRRLKADLVIYYKILNNLTSINLNDHFTIRKSFSISTRSTGPSLLKPFCRTNRFTNNFFFRSINICNTLPVTITNATSLFAFKRLLSNFDLSSFLYGQLITICSMYCYHCVYLQLKLNLLCAQHCMLNNNVYYSIYSYFSIIGNK